MTASRRSQLPAAALVLLFIAGCGKSPGPGTSPPGETKGVKTRALETGAKALQGARPTEKLDIHLVGFHLMKDDPHHQMAAHHFCRQVNEDFAQCALFDGSGENANLTGIEYIISEKLYSTLAPPERKFWHPHNYEILSGTLAVPGVPAAAEKELMKGKMNSYGKTWHVWDTGGPGIPGTPLPTGESKLAWSFNRDAEMKPGLLEATERELAISAAEKRRQRADLVGEAHPQEGVEALRSAFPSAGPYPPGVTERK